MITPSLQNAFNQNYFKYLDSTTEKVGHLSRLAISMLTIMNEHEFDAYGETQVGPTLVKLSYLLGGQRVIAEREMADISLAFKVKSAEKVIDFFNATVFSDRNLKLTMNPENYISLRPEAMPVSLLVRTEDLDRTSIPDPLVPPKLILASQFERHFPRHELFVFKKAVELNSQSRLANVA